MLRQSIGSLWRVTDRKMKEEDGTCDSNWKSQLSTSCLWLYAGHKSWAWWYQLIRSLCCNQMCQCFTISLIFFISVWQATVRKQWGTCPVCVCACYLTIKKKKKKSTREQSPSQTNVTACLTSRALFPPVNWLFHFMHFIYSWSDHHFHWKSRKVLFSYLSHEA